MGLLSLVGDFAKGFAESYVEERGIEGTISDVKDLASGFVSGFKGDDEERQNDFSEQWDKLLQRLKKSLELNDYGTAASQLDNYYRQYENNEKDYWYYNYRAYIYVSWLESLSFDDRKFADYTNVVKSAISKAYDLAESQEQHNDICEIEESLNNILVQSKYLQKWSKLIDKVQDYINLGQYEKADETLENHYHHEEDEIDFAYYKEKLEIYIPWLISGKCLDIKRMKENIESFIQYARQKTSDSECLDILSALEQRYQTEKNKQNYIGAIVEELGNNVPKKEQKDSLFTDDELEYMEEFKACLADDGQVTEKERRLLSRLCKSLGITETRAAELEKQCVAPNLSDEEKEYLEEYKACLEDNAITDKERRLLDRLCKSLGISEERASKIEKMA